MPAALSCELPAEISGGLILSFMTISPPPSDWRDLQRQVARILAECGMDAATDVPLTLVRGTVDADVYAIDRESVPETIYVCECKHWSTRVPKTVVHSFRTVVQDGGAHHGLLISSQGFQAGAVSAANLSNVRLLTWDAFQAMFETRWVERHFVPELARIAEPFLDYTDPWIGSRISKALDSGGAAVQDRFFELRERHGDLGGYVLAIRVAEFHRGRTRGDVLGELPLAASAPEVASRLPQDIANAVHRRELLDLLIKHVRAAIGDFESAFGRSVV